jgi:hypothetical protein
LADGISGSSIAKWIGPPIFAGFIGLWAGTPYGPALTALASVIAAFCGLGFAIWFDRKVAILGAGAAPEGSPEHKAYEGLRASLDGANLPERLYAKWLTGFLDGIERLFDDLGMARLSLFPHAFGLKRPTPLWTAATFDYCLFLALYYPILTIFIIWAASSASGQEVGLVEGALGLKPDLPVWRRGLALALAVFAIFGIWQTMRTQGFRSLAWLLGVNVAGALAALVAGSDVGSMLVAYAIGGASVGIVVFLAAGRRLSNFDSLGGATTFAGAYFGAVAFGGAVAFADGHAPDGMGDWVEVAAGLVGGMVGGIAALAIWSSSKLALKARRAGVYQALFTTMMIVACLASALLLSSLSTWKSAGPLLLVVGLLTLLNAPFNWASFGVTRGLLRRGLELGAWWPLGLAITDAVLALLAVCLLAFVMILGVQAFDDLAVLGGGTALLPLDALLDGIGRDPVASKYWWIYTLLLSAMVPSLANLVIGGMALTRGIPGLGRQLLKRMPAGKPMMKHDLQWVAFVLTMQDSIGFFLGVLAVFFLAWFLFYQVMPLFGLSLLGMAHDVVAFDLPAQIGARLAGVWRQQPASYSNTCDLRHGRPRDKSRDRAGHQAPAAGAWMARSDRGPAMTAPKSGAFSGRWRHFSGRGVEATRGGRIGRTISGCLPVSASRNSTIVSISASVSLWPSWASPITATACFRLHSCPLWK